jgi:hypothetical protein
VSSPSAAGLPAAARQAAWDARWRRLLSEPPSSPEPDSIPADEGVEDRESST